MSHHTGKDSYKSLQERLNRVPQRAPVSDTLYKILAILFSEKEAGLVAQLPIRPFTVEMAARIWKMSPAAARVILDELAGRAILLDSEHQGAPIYMLPPPMAGFFEFSLMRLRGDLDQKLLSQLFHEYLNVEEDFVKDLFLGSETRLGRVFIQESVLSSEQAIHVLDYERASQFIQTSRHMGISSCYCRHKAHHLEQACSAPLDICMSFNGVADSLIRHGHARRVDAVEGMELLAQAYEHNLVQCGENVREQVSFICNCCGCCCEGLIAAKKFGMLQPLHTTNFLPQVDAENCTGCGLCHQACPIAAITVASSQDDPEHKKIAQVDEAICLGCGVCLRACRKKSIQLKSRAQRVVTPLNSVHRTVLMAIEKGLLQNLIFDNQAYGSHRAMAAILGVILKLPPLKQAMASQQMKSVYLEKLIRRVLN